MDSNRTATRAAFATLGLALLAALGPAQASDDASFDIDPRFRARIAKEKVKQLVVQSHDAKAQPGTGKSAACGSQSIGNVDTGGRIGATPREVFVFAPNAINLVTAQGCR